MTRARNKSKFVWVLCCLEVQYKKVSSYSEPQTLDVQIDEVTGDMARKHGYRSLSLFLILEIIVISIPVYK